MKRQPFILLTLLAIMTLTTPAIVSAQAPRGNSRDGSFFTPEALPYSVLHMREFMPTTNVPRNNDVPLTNFRYRLMEESIDRLLFTPIGSDTPISWKESLALNHTDGIIILHQGKIVYERYFGEMTPTSLHALMSVSKSFTGTLAETLVAEGLLDPTRKVAYYLPELAESGFGDATVRQVMDMTTAIRYSEEYTDPDAEVWGFSAAGNAMLVHPEGTPQGFHDYLATIQSNGIHGQQFGYRTVNTDVLGWIVERVGGAPLAEQLQSRIWGRMGMEQDAYYQVDATGTAFAGGGLNASLRDLARFGEMMRCRGRWHGRQIVPAEAVDDIRFGSDPAPFEASSYSKHLPGWSYRSMWWITNNPGGAFMARGVHGQAIYIDPMAEMVIVRNASHPQASNIHNDAISLPAYQAVADFLSGAR
ncbi:MAG: serine hydrolase [Tidjanibacter sp.]|nr:serine hydrolase [Tidjanibacter sp.]